MSDPEESKPGTRFSLPPVPDLIPLATLEAAKVRKEDDKGCKRRHVRVMGEQRSRRTSAATPETIDASTTSRRRQRRKRSKSATEPDTITTTNMTDTSANPRVNPIFLWVRQEDTKIVDVKCEDYDKRNRILLTKTAHGWRAIPRMESLNTSSPAINTLNVKRKKRHRKKRAKCKAIGIQVEEQCFKPGGPHSDLEEINVESHIPSHTIHVNRKLTLQEDPQAEETTPGVTEAIQTIDTSLSMSSPLDKLLAVAELELKSCQPSSFPDVDDLEDVEGVEEVKNESYLDNLVLDQTRSGLQMAGINYNELQGDYCDYNEDEDNTLVMDDILNRLEQSLGNAELQEAMETNNNNTKEQEKENGGEQHSMLSSVDEQTHTDEPMHAEEEHEELEEAAVDSETSAAASFAASCDVAASKDDVDDILPTDLSCSKRREASDACDSTPCVSGASYDAPETLQSPEPSGIPAVTPDLCQLTSSSSPSSHAVEEQPLNLVGKPRKSESPLVSCSEEIRVTSCTKSQDLHVTKNKDLTAEKTVLEKTPFEQLEYILKHTKLRIPDPLLVPKDRLNVILTTPATEIPRLLFERPELKLPDALAFPHLLEDPDILVITVTQLQSILRKHFQTEKIEEYVLNKAVAATTTPAPEADVVTSTAKVQAKKTTPTVEPKQPKQTPKSVKSRDDSSRANRVLSDVIASGADMHQNSSAFNQWMWFPYLYQLETANNLLKTAGSPYGMYPPTYQYQGFPQNPPQAPPPPLTYQQELLKLSNLQLPDGFASLASPKKFKYSSLIPEPKQQKTGNGGYFPFFPQQCFPAETAASVQAIYKHKNTSGGGGSSGSSRHYNRSHKVGNSVQRTAGGGGFVSGTASAGSKGVGSGSKLGGTRQLMCGVGGGVQQPIDLSSSSGCRFPINMSRLAAAKNSAATAEVDVAEVGSTTSGLEECHPGLQQHLCDTTHGQVGLWHPLFGK